jgi:hypothetical protein
LREIPGQDREGSASHHRASGTRNRSPYIDRGPADRSCLEGLGALDDLPSDQSPERRRERHTRTILTYGTSAAPNANSTRETTCHKQQKAEKIHPPSSAETPDCRRHEPAHRCIVRTNGANALSAL